MKNRQTVRNVQILKGMVIFAGIILIVFGIAMIFRGIKGQGSITINTSIIEGSINTNYVGLAAIFLGSLLELGAILKTYRFSRKKSTFKSADLEFMVEEEIEMTRSPNEKGSEE